MARSSASSNRGCSPSRTASASRSTTRRSLTAWSCSKAGAPAGRRCLTTQMSRPQRCAENVVENSGVGSFDPVAIDAFLADKEVVLDATIDVFTEGLNGSAATTDMETLFQLIHLVMTEPRVDPVALEQYIDNELPLAEDPSINPNYARFKLLTETRYTDPRYQLLSVDDLESVEPAQVEAVFRDRFGDASDWAFSFNGDFDISEAAELARVYSARCRRRVASSPSISPNPAARRSHRRDDTGRRGRSGERHVPLYRGRHDRAPDDVVARLLQQVITARLTDVIREELGESYSPFAAIELTGGHSAWPRHSCPSPLARPRARRVDRGAGAGGRPARQRRHRC